MITDRKVELYIKFGGDDDMWQRAASEQNQRSISSKEWSEIGQMASELLMLENDLISQKYKEEIQERIASTKCSKEVLSKLKAISK